jgi:hypothetical protein
MFAWWSCTASFASSMNIVMNSWSSAMFGRMRLTATRRSKPSTPKAFALKTSAMPPTLMRSRREYLPKGIGCFTWVARGQVGRAGAAPAARRVAPTSDCSTAPTIRSSGVAAAPPRRAARAGSSAGSK